MSRRYFLLPALFLVLLAGCNLDDPIDERPRFDGESRAGDTARPDTPPTVDGDSEDVTRDATASDADCQPESDRSFCENARVECGSVTALDNCGEDRTVDCNQFDGFGCDGADGPACTTPECAEGVCETRKSCEGTDTECGCDTCENCDAKDGWYESGAPYSCSVCGSPTERCTTCVDKERRDYFCNDQTCDYEVVDERTRHTDCNTCTDSSGCKCACRDGSCREGSDQLCKC